MSQAILAGSRTTKTSGVRQGEQVEGGENQQCGVQGNGFLNLVCWNIWDEQDCIPLFPQSLWNKHQTPLLTQHQDESVTRLYSPMKEGQEGGVEPNPRLPKHWKSWIQIWPSQTTACLGDGLFLNPNCTGGYSSNSSSVRMTHGQLRHWDLLTQHPSSAEWDFPVLMKHSSALMLIFESVRSQMPSGCCKKWDVPTDCKGKWGCLLLLLCIWTIISFQEGKGRNWGEKRCCSSGDALELAMVHCFSLLWEHRPASHWGQVLHQISLKSHREALTLQLCVPESQHSSQWREERKFPADKEKTRFQMYPGTNLTYSKYRQKFSLDLSRSQLSKEKM